MYSREDWTKAITKLTRLTAEGEVTWDISSGINTDAVDELDRSYKAQYGGKGYFVYSGRIRAYNGDFDELYWESVTGFEIWRVEGPMGFTVRIARSPLLPAIGSLFSTIEARFAADQDALKGLLD